MRIGRLGYCRVIVACKSGCCLFGYRDGGTNGSGALGDHVNPTRYPLGPYPPPLFLPETRTDSGRPYLKAGPRSVLRDPKGGANKLRAKQPPARQRTSRKCKARASKRTCFEVTRSPAPQAALVLAHRRACLIYQKGGFLAKEGSCSSLDRHAQPRFTK